MNTERNERVRINSLTNDRGPQKHFARKGIAESLAEMNFKIDYTLSSTNVLDKLHNAIKKFVKKQLSIRETQKEKMDYINSLDIDTVINLNVEEANELSDQEDIEHTKRIIYSCMSKANQSKINQEEMNVGKVTVYNDYFSLIGYFAFDCVISKKWEGAEVYFQKSPSKKKRPFNIEELVATVITIQALRKYEREHPGLLKELLVEKFINKENQLIGVPPSFTGIKEEFLSVAKSLKANVNKPTIFVDRKDLCLSFQYQERFDIELYEGKKTDWSKSYPYRQKVNQALSSVRFENLVDLRDLFLDGLSSFEEQDYKNYKEHPYFLALVNGFVRDANIAQFDYEEETDFRTCAKAFQEKKNIKLEHRKRMEHNKFLNFYGKVELDNDVRMPLFDIAEKDLLEISEAIPFPIRKDYEFKIKKLGKHRAEGLFYPGLKMVIIDVRSPKSFIHEVGHQLDHLFAEGKRSRYYSETAAFRHIRNLYTQAMDKKVNELPEDNLFRKQWEGNTKYSKLYFLNPTEIFARSFEVYMLKYGLSLNSLLKTEDLLKESIPHILDGEYVEIITEFFDDMLRKFEKESEEFTRKETDKPKNKQKVVQMISVKETHNSHSVSKVSEINVMTGIEQLSLF
ncbi:hypothetical protein AAGG74_17760 [Bacillus mexicanus]|uniref:hypothetical protein n=1 Tax=Bacillus mexicanus TaxID=2834415 RepID=UPI003D23F254